MSLQGGLSASWRRFGLALIALGLAVRVLIAPGLMPQATPAGLTLTLCTGQGPVTYKLDLHGGQPSAEMHDPCPYGALALTPLVPLPVVAVAPLIVTEAAPDFVPVRRQPHRGVPAPPPPATGPPLLG